MLFERKYGETYTQAIEATGLNYQSVADAKWVAEKYEVSERTENLSWTHHRHAASLPPDTRREVLATAAVLFRHREFI